MTSTAIAHPNIALVKYWGKRPGPDNRPAVGSLSVTLDDLHSRTAVTPDRGLDADQVLLDGQPAADAFAHRVSAGLDLLRPADAPRARVDTANTFPTAAGLASSASGFAALALAADAAYGGGHDRSALSQLARRMSGSAARSLFGGFVWLDADADDPPAEPLLDATAWPLEVVVAVVSDAAKDVGSTAGMNRTRDTAPYWNAWLEHHPRDMQAARAAVLARDFDALAVVTEGSCLAMHALAMAARPGLVYWQGATVDGLHRVRALRAAGTPCCFTIDAGPQLKAICAPGAGAEVAAALAAVPGVQRVLRTGLGAGARLVEDP